MMPLVGCDASLGSQGDDYALLAHLIEASVTETAHAEIIRGLRESLEN